MGAAESGRVDAATGNTDDRSADVWAFSSGADKLVGPTVASANGRTSTDWAMSQRLAPH